MTFRLNFRRQGPFNSWIPFKSSGMKKANMLMSICFNTAITTGTDATTFRLNFRRQSLLWFFQSLAASYTLPGILSQPATSLLLSTALQPYGSLSALLLSVYFALHFCEHVCFLKPSLAQHSQQHFSSNVSAESLHFSAYVVALILGRPLASCTVIQYKVIGHACGACAWEILYP